MPDAYLWTAPKRETTCANCGAPMKPGESESRRCKKCAFHWRRNGVENPYLGVDGRTARFAKERG